MSVDFTNCQVNKFKLFGGANGNKISINYQGQDYMLKFPPKAKPRAVTSYINSCISEHIACQIFKSLGMDTQETILGTYKDKIVVACKDFTGGGFELKEFAQLKNAIIVSEQNRMAMELSFLIFLIPFRNSRFYHRLS
ncbi:hypothetical protein [Scatolibacter rhodanostii]|uniref:hypothetical protein n=1 Tax=Scatolibacter rhodanostii TaxID=2014781 RepID=UPI001FA85955|nr:hypothetical protein [Scatolibacter rhodanostii]